MSFHLIQAHNDAESAKQALGYFVANAAHGYAAGDVGKVVRLAPDAQALASNTPGATGNRLLLAVDAAGYWVSSHAAPYQITGFNFGTPYKTVYLASAGAVTETRPTTPGEYIVEIGQVLTSSDTLQWCPCSTALLISSQVSTETVSGFEEVSVDINDTPPSADVSMTMTITPI